MKPRRSYDRNSVKAVQEAIKADPSGFYEMILGAPNLKLSNRKQWRYGRRGSLAVKLSGKDAGLWFDHELQQGGDGLALIMRERGVGFPEALEIAKKCVGIAGKYPMNWAYRSQKPPKASPKTPTTGHRDAALRIWTQSVPITGTPAQSYLEQRAINADNLDHVLRFLNACPRGKTRSPAMVAIFRDVFTDKACAVHRIFLNEDGSKASAAEYPAKMMLGPTEHAAIKISPDELVEHGLGITEGIEDALSISCAGWAPVWAVGSAGKIAAFPPIQGVDCLTIFADADEAGLNAARTCIQIWNAAKRDGILWTPPQPYGDWNEVAKAGLIL